MQSHSAAKPPIRAGQLITFSLSLTEEKPKPGPNTPKNERDLRVLRVRYGLETRQDAEHALDMMCQVHRSPGSDRAVEIVKGKEPLCLAIRRQQELFRTAICAIKHAVHHDMCIQAIAYELGVPLTTAAHYRQGFASFLEWAQEIAAKDGRKHVYEVMLLYDVVSIKSLCNGSKSDFMRQYDHRITGADGMDTRMPSFLNLMLRVTAQGRESVDRICHVLNGSTVEGNSESTQHRHSIQTTASYYDPVRGMWVPQRT